MPLQVTPQKMSASTTMWICYPNFDDLQKMIYGTKKIAASDNLIGHTVVIDSQGMHLIRCTATSWKLHFHTACPPWKNVIHTLEKLHMHLLKNPKETLIHTQCCTSYSLFVTSYSYSYITKNTTSYRYKLQNRQSVTSYSYNVLFVT
jgi:hypothetical protein